MPRGGKRPGAGRKPGSAWKGATLRPTAIRNLAKSRVREVLTTKSDPVAVLVEIANDPDVETALRISAAAAAAPNIFPRLSASVVATAAPVAKEEHAHLIERIIGRSQHMTAPPVLEMLPGRDEAK